ncbi:mRNA decay activator protein zfp36 [Saitoella coloradoensis]
MSIQTSPFVNETATDYFVKQRPLSNQFYQSGNPIRVAVAKSLPCSPYLHHQDTSNTGSYFPSVNAQLQDTSTPAPSSCRDRAPPLTAYSSIAESPFFAPHPTSDAAASAHQTSPGATFRIDEGVPIPANVDFQNAAASMAAKPAFNLSTRALLARRRRSGAVPQSASAPSETTGGGGGGGGPSSSYPPGHGHGHGLGMSSRSLRRSLLSMGTVTMPEGLTPESSAKSSPLFDRDVSFGQGGMGMGIGLGNGSLPSPLSRTAQTPRTPAAAERERYSPPRTGHGQTAYLTPTSTHSTAQVQGYFDIPVVQQSHAPMLEARRASMPRSGIAGVRYVPTPPAALESGLSPGSVLISPSSSMAAKFDASGKRIEIKKDLYKTELCKSWEVNGTCRYGSKCQFAHGQTQLKSVQRHPKYKTEPCETFIMTGSCPYGERCCFLHTHDLAVITESRAKKQRRARAASMGAFSPQQIATELAGLRISGVSYPQPTLYEVQTLTHNVRQNVWSPTMSTETGGSISPAYSRSTSCSTNTAITTGGIPTLSGATAVLVLATPPVSSPSYFAGYPPPAAVRDIKSPSMMGMTMTMGESLQQQQHQQLQQLQHQSMMRRY